MSSAMLQPSRHGEGAPSYQVPSRRIVSVEHPCITTHVDNAFTSLGGEHHLKRLLEATAKDGREARGLESSAAASFRPNDCFAQKVASTATPTQNVLVRVTLPKRTGRKRKRGSDEPFAYDPSASPSAQLPPTTTAGVLQRMRDSPDAYTIEPIGMIEDTHCFEALPDYQTRADEVPVMRGIRDHLGVPKYEHLKGFRVDLDCASHEICSFPGPPTFVPEADTFDWQYQQAVSLQKPKHGRNNGIPTSAAKIRQLGSSLTAEQVPQGPRLGAENPDLPIDPLRKALVQLLRDRPIVTLRAATGILKDYNLKAISLCIQTLGYFVTKGPWRDTVVRYGIDPRKDPKYRMYQTLRFTLYHTREINDVLKKRGLTADPHVFNGTTLSEVGVAWQLCDLSDPLLQELANTNELRTECDHEKMGWYFNGTTAKMRVIMREKMIRIVNGENIPGDDYYRVLADLPNQIAGFESCVLPLSYSLETRQLARDVAREATKSPPRYYYILKNSVHRIGQENASERAESDAGEEAKGNDDSEGEYGEAEALAGAEDLHAPSLLNEVDEGEQQDCTNETLADVTEQ